MPTPPPSALGNVVSTGAATGVPEGSPPTSYAAYAVLQGEKGALLKFSALTLLRSLIIAPGMAVAGIRGKKLLYGSMAASGVVSAVALGYCYALGQAAAKEASAGPSPLEGRRGG